MISYSGPLLLLLQTWIRPQHVLASKGNIYFKVFLVIFYPLVRSLSSSMLATCSFHSILVSCNLSFMEYICNSSLVLLCLILVGAGYKN
jgi:hypothetical protein